MSWENKIFFRSEIPGKRLKELRRLERALGVRFRRPALLNRALAHRSYFSTSQFLRVKADNETLEFLGDAVLGLVISEELYRRYPVSTVGDLAKIKAQVVSRATLAEMAKGLGLDQWLLLGPGEAARGEGQRSSIIGSALEAVLGALYLDRGLSATYSFIRRIFSDQMEAVATGESALDHKSLLQEYAVRYFREIPIYRVVGETGPGHRRRFHVTVGWHGKIHGEGVGPNKKASSQEAARVALEYFLHPKRVS